jgi:hypothetical protein
MTTLTNQTRAAVLDTPEQIAAFRLLSLRSMLKLEILGMTRRGRSAYSIIKQESGLRGSKISVYNQLSALIGRPGFDGPTAAEHSEAAAVQFVKTAEAK